ncbi:MAG: recombination regulator RecX [Rugosibacter sp.]
MNILRSRAIRLLARREHSRAELARKLAAHGAQEEIDAVINELQASQLQSDARFAESYVQAHAARWGGPRLRQKMAASGLARELIDAQLARADLPDELARAREVWARKFSAAPADAKEWARQARFLQGRGFASETIRRLLKNPCEDMAGEDAA